VVLFLLTFTVVTAADQISKRLVIARGRFHVINSRRGWGSRRARRVRLVAWFALGAAAGLLATSVDRLAIQAGAGAVVGGMAGNLIDDLRGRGVTDFIDLRVWPVFNLADVAIVVGALLAASQLIMR
jgi:lipoprotein signal peptidase